MIKIRFRRTDSISDLSGKKGECILIEHSLAGHGQVIAVSELASAIRLLVPLEGTVDDARKPASRGESKTQAGTTVG